MPRRDSALVTLRVLGVLEATVNGAVVWLGGPIQRAVLARILVAGNVPVSAERIVEDVWGERTTADAVHPLVSRLRGLLGREAIPKRPDGYVVDRDVVFVDADAFADEVECGRRALARGADADAALELESALSRWNGELPFGGSRRRRGGRRRGGQARRAAGGRRRGARRRARAARPRRRRRGAARGARGALPAAGVAGRPARHRALRRGPPGRRARRVRALPPRPRRAARGAARRPAAPGARGRAAAGAAGVGVGERACAGVEPAAAHPVVRGPARAGGGRRRGPRPRHAPPGRPLRDAGGGQDRAGLRAGAPAAPGGPGDLVGLRRGPVGHRGRAGRPRRGAGHRPPRA